MTCHKVSYSSIKEVKNALHAMKHSHKYKKQATNKKSYQYICPDCGNYHLTTMSKLEYKRHNIQKKKRDDIHKKKMEEIKRRLFIIEQIKENKSLDKVAELSESWMALIIKTNNWILKCEVAEETHIIRGKIKT